jgi:hypothetical protein
VLKIQNAYLVPGQSVRFDTAAEGVSVEVTAGGVTVTGDEKNSTAARRRLMGGDGADGTAQGPTPSEICDPQSLCVRTMLSTNRFLRLEYNPYDTIDVVMAKIRDKLIIGVPRDEQYKYAPEYQRLIWGTTQLIDHQVFLKIIPIDEGSTLSLVLRLPGGR